VLVIEQTCELCSWFHDFGTHGYCKNPDKNLNELNKVTYEDMAKKNECEGFDDDLWFGG